ncbi:hypothetical protein JG731_02260 [Chlamydia gallinacea]|uniref:Uncharacterized protein n=2 Tax=Chlamydia gallinacea TaxID=1457153 RepID=A0A173DZL9_9CHLA|nr:hypothetical protein [Chlamydia gallinacea]ANG66382.1 hypothetical protein M787_003540 [Chlamydia gallinacea 08-1274/3]MBX6680175.1 hypothetical protein [Chlamydia gallinacea]
MMSSKRVSQLAMLSILLIFTHTVSHANLTVPAKVCSIASSQPLCSLDSEVKSVGSQKEEVSLVKSKKQKVLQAQVKSKKQKVLQAQAHAAENKSCKGSSKKGKLRLKRVKQKSCVKEAQKTPNSSFLQTIFVKQREVQPQHKVSQEEPSQVDKCVDAALTHFDISKISKEEKERLFQELAREQRISKRKSSRSALETRLKDSKIPRGGSVTSTLRYDVEKAAALKVKRNASVNSHLREQKTAHSRRASAAALKAAKLETTHLAGEPGKQEKTGSRERSEKQDITENYFQEASSAGNTNVNSYIKAKQYRCDSRETDWPCDSCVSKRRANSSISICTMAVTVLAIIIGAIIICNASADSTTQSGGTTTP